MRQSFPTLWEVESLQIRPNSTFPNMQCEAEVTYLESNQQPQPFYGQQQQQRLPQQQQQQQQPRPAPDSVDLVLSEVRRLEEVSRKNEEELDSLASDGNSNNSNGGNGGNGTSDGVIKSEISQLKQRLAGTDQELQRTNVTLR